MHTPWLEALVEASHQALLGPRGTDARAYLASRGVSADQMVRYRLGFSGGVRVEAGTQEFLRWCPRYFPDRLVFPLADALGHTIGLQTRSLVEKRYQQFFAYPSELYPYCFGLPQAIEAVWQTGQLVVVEGVFDCLAVAHVTPAVVAALTAGVPVAFRRLCRRYVTHLTALFDMDPPGRTGASRLATDPEKTYVVTSPCYPAHDPGDLLQAGRIHLLGPLLPPGIPRADSPSETSGTGL